MSEYGAVILAVYVALVVVLAVVSGHRLYLAMVARRLRVPRQANPSEWPRVLVQLPLYNERYVAERLIDAVCQLDYPREALSIQVLDDSTDDTVALCADRVGLWQARGIAIEHVRRPNREQYKAGALAHGLTLNDSPLVAIFDADFVPPPDFLLRMVPSFSSPEIGMVQARWGHLNREASQLTRSQAILLDAHFVNEHGGRSALGSFFNFNGTAGIWRRDCIIDAGGWSGETLTEDLDLSYRAQLKGWRFVYRPDVEVPAELPADVSAFKTQQHRWAKGSIETAMRLLPQIWSSDRLTLKQRLEATFHLGGNFAYPLVLLLALLMPFALLARFDYDSLTLSIVDAVVFAGSMGSLITFYVLAERAVDQRGVLKRLPLTLAVGVGLAVNNTRAVLEALLRKRSAFARTPKWGVTHRSKVDAAYRLPINWQAYVELALGGYLLTGVAAALFSGRVVVVPFLVLFALGFLYLAVGTLQHASRNRRVALSALTPSPSASTIVEPHEMAAENHG